MIKTERTIIVDCNGMVEPMTRYEWEKLLESSYTIMPKWYYNKTECDRQYNEYRKSFLQNMRRNTDEEK